MFSPELYPAAITIGDAADELREGLNKLSQENELQAVLIVSVDPSGHTFEVVAAHNLPIEPFNGGEKRWVADVLDECFKLHPLPHIHAIGEYALAQIVRKFSHSEHGTNRVWFIPFSIEDQPMVFLGFPRNESIQKKVPDGLARRLGRLLLSLSMITAHRQFQQRLDVMEVFVKEVGHDIASSVQATIATLRNISQGRIRGEAILRKAKQVEEEVMAAFRIADGLGIAVDPEYKIREPHDYDLIDVLNAALEHHRSEAEEGRNSIKLNVGLKSVPMYGDRKAIEVALGHLLMNAIKYSYTDSYVSITCKVEKQNVSLTIGNKGLPLPKGEERGRIWEFGYRGQLAKEMHVNGSGIGLYTVRKIVQAHDGQVTAASDKQDDAITKFTITLPTSSLRAKLLS